MKFTEYIARRRAFTTEALLAAADSRDAARRQLKEAVGDGSVERVRRGLYVFNAGRFEGAGVDPYEVVAALDPDAVLSYHGALEASRVANCGVGASARNLWWSEPMSTEPPRQAPIGPRFPPSSLRPVLPSGQRRRRALMARRAQPSRGREPSPGRPRQTWSRAPSRWHPLSPHRTRVDDVALETRHAPLAGRARKELA